VTVTRTLARLSTLWADKRPGFEKRLRPGASAASLAKFAKSLGLPLPREVVAFYAWHDGAKDEHEPLEGNYGWFSLAGIAKHKKMLDTMGFEDETTYPKYCWNVAWLPFLQFNYEDVVCLDTRSGAVFERYNARRSTLVLAPSFRAWLDAHVAITAAAKTLSGASEEDTCATITDAFTGRVAKQIRSRVSPGFPKSLPTAKSLF
jgi:hypothetical protein